METQTSCAFLSPVNLLSVKGLLKVYLSLKKSFSNELNEVMHIDVSSEVKAQLTSGTSQQHQFSIWSIELDARTLCSCHRESF